MRRLPRRADCGCVTRLIATLLGGALLLSGCSTQEGKRAQELLHRAELAQAALSSATFEGSVAVLADGETFTMSFDGAFSKEGAAFAMKAPNGPDGTAMSMRFVARGGGAWINEGNGWESAPLPDGASALSGSMGAQAFQELARYVKDVRVAEGQTIAGVPTTTIAGEIDTAGMLQAMLKLSPLSNAGGFSFDLEDLGVELGDIKAVLSIDERTQLLSSARVTLALEAEGKTMSLDVRYRLTSVNEPVELPSPRG
jgi:hypothetical protein